MEVEVKIQKKKQIYDDCEKQIEKIATEENICPRCGSNQDVIVKEYKKMSVNSPYSYVVFVCEGRDFGLLFNSRTIDIPEIPYI